MIYMDGWEREVYTVGRFFWGLQILQMVQKREFVEIIFTNDIGGVRRHSLQYMWTCVYYTPSYTRRYNSW